MILEVVRHLGNLIGGELANSAFHGGVFDLRGNLIQRIDLPVRDKNGLQALELVTQLIDTLLESCNGPVLGIGHVRVAKQVTLCSCEQRGCLQTVVSSRALIKKAKVLFQDNRNSTLRQLVTSSEEITFNIVMLGAASHLLTNESGLT